MEQIKSSDILSGNCAQNKIIIQKQLDLLQFTKVHNIDIMIIYYTHGHFTDLIREN